jgi:hypothetical protein
MKVIPENEFRKQLLSYAKRHGAEQDLQEEFNKWDRILALAPDNEKADISKMGILAIQQLLDIHSEEHDGLTINGQIVVPAKVKP